MSCVLTAALLDSGACARQSAEFAPGCCAHYRCEWTRGLLSGLSADPRSRCPAGPWRAGCCPEMVRRSQLAVIASPGRARAWQRAGPDYLGPIVSIGGKRPKFASVGRDRGGHRALRAALHLARDRDPALGRLTATAAIAETLPLGGGGQCSCSDTDGLVEQAHHGTSCSWRVRAASRTASPMRARARSGRAPPSPGARGARGSFPRASRQGVAPRSRP
jgi:hypothetical protein